MARFAVIGAGAWGTALACIARRAGNEAVLWARNAKLAAQINAGEGNPAYLPGIALDPGIHASGDLAAVVSGADCVLLAVPAQALRETATALAGAIDADESATIPMVICAKGIERDSGLLMTEVLNETLPAAPQAVLSGPNFADEIAAGLPAAATLACIDPETGNRIAELLCSDRFRPYVSGDPVGAAIGGSVKNVLAIACGIVDGRKLGDNARAALITRGMAEIIRLALAKGAQRETLSGLSGFGDIALSCSGGQSRNMALGMALGAGETPAQAMGRHGTTEGVETSSSVMTLAERLDVDMPICETVDGILHRGEDVGREITRLLARPLRNETA